MTRKIVLYPSKILRVKTPRVTEADVDRSELVGEIEELERILKRSDNGAGLAAPQIGLAKRFFGLKKRGEEQVDIFINPVIKKRWGEKVIPWIVKDNGEKEVFLEGCLSFPDFFGAVRRYLKISVSWQELSGGALVARRAELSGLEAIVFQHELDHLDGVLFVDHIKRDGGEIYKWVGEEKVAWAIDDVVRD